MKGRRFYSMLLGFVLFAGNAKADTAGQPGPAVQPPKPSTFSGFIEEIHPGARTLAVKAVLIMKNFAVAPDCEVILTDKPKAKLDDLKVGDEVRVTYQEQSEGVFVAHRIEQRGAGAADRDAARDKEHLKDILTPDPSERK